MFFVFIVEGSGKHISIHSPSFVDCAHTFVRSAAYCAFHDGAIFPVWKSHRTARTPPATSCIFIGIAPLLTCSTVYFLIPENQMKGGGVCACLYSPRINFHKFLKCRKFIECVRYSSRYTSQFRGGSHCCCFVPVFFRKQ